jgi:hypothetical protein
MMTPKKRTAPGAPQIAPIIPLVAHYQARRDLLLLLCLDYSATRLIERTALGASGGGKILIDRADLDAQIDRRLPRECVGTHDRDQPSQSCFASKLSNVRVTPD